MIFLRPELRDSNYAYAFILFLIAEKWQSNQMLHTTWGIHSMRLQWTFPDSIDMLFGPRGIYNHNVGATTNQSVQLKCSIVE